MFSLRALLALGVAAGVAAVALACVARWTEGWGTVQGVCGTVVGATLLLMVLMARAGQAAAERSAEDDVQP